MKKSELYQEAALAVLRDGDLPDEAKLEIIVELMDRKKWAEHLEERTEKEAEAK